MKRTNPIREWKAIEEFRSHLSNDPGTIQMVLSLAENCSTAPARSLPTPPRSRKATAPDDHG
jgi:hypothetical protein